MAAGKWVKPVVVVQFDYYAMTVILSVAVFQA
jgi:hypothetical protein